MAQDGHRISMVLASSQKHYQVGPLFRARVKVAELKLQHMVVVTQVETCTRPSQVMCMVVWKSAAVHVSPCTMQILWLSKKVTLWMCSVLCKSNAPCAQCAYLDMYTDFQSIHKSRSNLNICNVLLNQNCFMYKLHIFTVYYICTDTFRCLKP